MSAFEWPSGQPVEIRVRRHGVWIEMDDEGEAVRRAGRPAGWLEAAEKIVALEGMNVNRAGRVFVNYGPGSHADEEIQRRLAQTALAVYHGLLDLSEE